MPTAPVRGRTNTADLIALALEHRVAAERSTCLEDQCALHRVADIYTVLATMDLPLSSFAEIVCPPSTDDCASVDAPCDIMTSA
jgi:hypothetical protein